MALSAPASRRALAAGHSRHGRLSALRVPPAAHPVRAPAAPAPPLLCQMPHCCEVHGAQELQIAPWAARAAVAEAHCDDCVAAGPDQGLQSRISCACCVVGCHCCRQCLRLVRCLCETARVVWWREQAEWRRQPCEQAGRRCCSHCCDPEAVSSPRTARRFRANHCPASYRCHCCRCCGWEAERCSCVHSARMHCCQTRQGRWRLRCAVAVALQHARFAHW